LEQDELLREVVRALEWLEIRYLVTGSIATIFFGEPRFTNDIDVVVSLSQESLDALIEEFPSPEFYVSRTAARQAVERCGQFNVIHPSSGLKVDFMVADETPFNISRFSRAIRVRPGEDYDAMFAAPEDVILMKMEYFRRGGSEKHLRDIAGILEISGDDLDRAYLEKWTELLELGSIWQELLPEAES
jgi:hypothetical protein